MNKIISLFLFLILLSLYISAAQTPNIDPELQKFCEEINRDFEGCIIIMETQTGKIRAFSNPEFGIKTKLSPGSLFKPVIAYIGLNAQMITPYETINCTYYFKKYGMTFKCSNSLGHGQVDLVKAIGESCNFYFYTLSTKLGSKIILKYFNDLGLHQKTGIDLPGESENELPVALNEVELVNIGIGLNDNLNLTPIKILQVLNIFPSQGKYLVPNYYKENYKVSGKFIDFSLSEDEYILSGMKHAVEKGTCKLLGEKNLPVGGKTGTSPFETGLRKRNWAFFFGFYPYISPEYSIFIVVKGGYGSTSAVPVAEEVFQLFEIDELNIKEK